MCKLDVLIVCALEREAQGFCDDYQVLYTGVGKVNATYSLLKYLSQKRPKFVINYGTAGSRDLPIGELVDCTRFVQRDMDKTGLGFERGVTAFEENIPTIIDFSRSSHNLIGSNSLCGTGDNFVQEIGLEMDDIEVFDMEAYALAKVCYLENIPFISYKFISDNADNKADKDWTANVAKGAKIFRDQVLRVLR